MTIYNSSEEENSTLLGRYCGSFPPPDYLISYTGTVLVTFVTDAFDNHLGFQLNYKTGKIMKTIIAWEDFTITR